MHSFLFILLGIIAVVGCVVLPFLLLIASAAIGARGNVDGALWLGRGTILACVPLDLMGGLLELAGAKGNPELNMGYMAREIVSTSLKELGKVKEALEIDEECMEFYKSKNAEQQAASAAVRMAMGYRDLGDFKKAGEIFDKAIPVLERNYASSDPVRRNTAAGSLALALIAKGQLLELQQDFSKAEKLQRTSAAVRSKPEGDGDLAETAQEAILGYSSSDESADLIPSWCALSGTLSRQGNFADANKFLELCEKAIERNPNTCLAMRLCVSVAVGRSARRENDLARAEKNLEYAYREIQGTSLNKKNGLFGEVYTELALLRHAQKRYDEAAKLFKESIPLLERRYTNDHPELLSPLVAYAEVLHAQHKSAAAHQAELQAQRIRDKYHIS